MTDNDREPLEMIAEEFAERYRRGEQPSVQDYVDRYPQWAADLRELLPPVAVLEEVRRRKSTRREEPEEAPCLERLGDFRILREIGRGGMGIVYEAFQESLGRHVAVKALPRHALLDKHKLERFEREAQAAARLHHTNIVPVFGVGEANGLHFYVMQLITGQGLDAVLSRLRRVALKGDTRGSALPTQTAIHTPAGSASTPGGGKLRTTSDVALASRDRLPPSVELDPAARDYWRRVAEIGRQVADALQYAHEQGTLHRDIKPANLLLDEQGRVWITDFGLAKLAEHDQLTKAGDILGTLEYMPPEGLQGNADERSDLYSLGMTLYELVTLRRPFGASHPGQMIKQIAAGIAATPRKVNPAIPRDLETIVLKATAREPAHRYSTARDMADDLERFLDDRPIEARRVAAPERAWRWAKRNPGAFVATAAVMGSLILAAGFGWFAYGKTRAALQRESEAAAQVQKNLDLSLESFEEIFDLALGDQQRETWPGFDRPFQPPPRPAVSEANAALIESILKFYDRFAEQNVTKPELQIDAAKAHRHIGDLQQRLGKKAEADRALRAAADLYQKLVGEYPDDPKYRFELADTQLAIEFEPRDRSSIDEAMKRYQFALDLAKHLETSVGNEPRYIDLESRAHARLASTYEHSKDVKQADQHYRLAISVMEPLIRGRAIGPYALQIAKARYALAGFLVRQEKLTDARALLDQSIADLRSRERRRGPMRGEIVTFGQARHLLAQHYAALASTLTSLGDETAAAEATKQAEAYDRPPERPEGEPGDGPRRGPRPDGPRGPGGPPPDAGPSDRPPRRGPPREGPPGGPPRDGRPPGPPHDGPPPRDDFDGPDGPPPRGPRFDRPEDGPPRRPPEGPPRRPPEDASSSPPPADDRP